MVLLNENCKRLRKILVFYFLCFKKENILKRIERRKMTVYVVYGIYMEKSEAEATKNLMMEQLYEKNKDNTVIEFGITEIDANDLVDLWDLN